MRVYIFICLFVCVFAKLHISMCLYFWMWLCVPICLCKAKNLKQHSVKPESSPRAKATCLIFPNFPAVFVSKLQNILPKLPCCICIQASKYSPKTSLLYLYPSFGNISTNILAEFESKHQNPVSSSYAAFVFKFQNSFLHLPCCVCRQDA